MKPAKRLNLLFTFPFFFGLWACSTATASPSAAFTQTSPASTPPAAVSTSTFVPIAITPSPLPTKPILPIITPNAIQVKRWKEYQTALAQEFRLDSHPEKVICEWDLLGQSDQEVYVWAVCTSTTPFGTTAEGEKLFSTSSMPAVIHLEVNGGIQNVEIPGPGISDYARLFPKDIQANFEYYHFGRAGEMADHLEWRREHPDEPPLIVLSAPPAPEPTATEWLPYNPNIVSDDRCEKLVATTLPVAGTEGMTNEEIVQRLFAIYLEKHLTLPPHHICRLENYRIEKTTSDSRIDFLAKEQGVDFVNWVIYSVQISEVPSSFVAGNGVFAADGWIVRKALIVGVTKVNDEYVLKLLGTGP